MFAIRKSSGFVEAELSALLQAAGGTLPVIKKDCAGRFHHGDYRCARACSETGNACGNASRSSTRCREASHTGRTCRG